MSIGEIISFLMNLLPYLNTGVIILIIGLGLEKLGLKVTKREYKRKPFESLLLGFFLIVTSSLISLLIQTQMSGLQPLVAFIILLGIYLTFTQV
jgi:xanthine/uracil permease